jgi:hypothetical protein
LPYYRKRSFNIPASTPDGLDGVRRWRHRTLALGFFSDRFKRCSLAGRARSWRSRSPSFCTHASRRSLGAERRDGGGRRFLFG